MNLKFIDFITNINEALDLSRVPPKQKKTVEVFLGRLQPIHKGHFKILKKMKNPVLVLIKGAKTSKNKKRNPFPLEYQEQLIKKVMPNLKIHIAPSGFLPLILFDIRRMGFEPIVVYAGSDRISSYKRMMNSLPDEIDLNIKFKETPRYCSATQVRNALKSNDFKTFKELMPKELHDQFETMKTFL